ncbi:MAG: hypothetical protein PHF84_05715 [bacterium]|nr:hypothetical protein [bacterium]
MRGQKIICLLVCLLFSVISLEAQTNRSGSNNIIQQKDTVSDTNMRGTMTNTRPGPETNITKEPGRKINKKNRKKGRGSENGDDEDSYKKILKFPFHVFSYKAYTSYYVVSGYMGDVNCVRLLKIQDTYSYKNSLKLIYNPRYSQANKGWAGLGWQWPPNNWGENKKGGYDLSEAKYLFFWARGVKGDELVEFKIGGAKGPYGDTDEASTGVISLSRKWELYKIDLRGKNLKNVITALTIIVTQQLNPNGLTLYLNEIYYSKKDTPEQTRLFDYSSPVDKQEGDLK